MIIRKIVESELLGMIRIQQGQRYLFVCERHFNTDVQDYVYYVGDKRRISFITLDTLFWYQLEVVENIFFFMETYEI